MADLTYAGVTVNRQWTEGGIAGKDLHCMLVTLELSTNGALTSGQYIPASALGLGVIEQSGRFMKSDDSVAYDTSPSYAGAYLVVLNLTTSVPLSVTGTFRGVVKGYK